MDQLHKSKQSAAYSTFVLLDATFQDKEPFRNTFLILCQHKGHQETQAPGYQMKR